MFEGNYLANRLATASATKGESLFAEGLDGTPLTYANFFNNAKNYAALLQHLGVKPGDRVAVQVDKSLEAIQIYIATVLCGGIFLPLNTAYTTREISYFLEDARPHVFICQSSKKSALQTPADTTGVQVLETLDADGTGSFNTKALDCQFPFTLVARSPDDIAAILYTSGTTGRSKGAMLSHKNLWSNADTLRTAWRFTAEDKLIHALPIFHTHGLFVAINVTLAAGSSLLFLPSFDPDAIIKIMPKATVLMGVPTFYVRLLEHAELDKKCVKNMRLFISGSAPLLVETHQQWQIKTGHEILERYGMTETNMNTSNPYHGDRIPGTVGKPLAGIEVRVCDPESEQELPTNSIGSIEVRGPNVFTGYWKMPEKTKEELRENGFFITGDLGTLDEQGYLSIIGRSKDLIISGGYNVYPKEIELLIDDLEGVNESAVIGLQHPDFGEAVSAVIVLQKGSTIDKASIYNALSHDLAKYKQPKKLFFVEQLPRNAMGKVQKKSLRDKFADSFL